MNDLNNCKIIINVWYLFGFISLTYHQNQLLTCLKDIWKIRFPAHPIGAVVTKATTGATARTAIFALNCTSRHCTWNEGRGNVSHQSARLHIKNHQQKKFDSTNIRKFQKTIYHINHVKQSFFHDTWLLKKLLPLSDSSSYMARRSRQMSWRFGLRQSDPQKPDPHNGSLSKWSSTKHSRSMGQ